MRPYFILAPHDDAAGALADMGVMDASPRQVFLSIAGMVAVITSVLVGSFVGLLLATLAWPLAVTASVGVVAFLVSVVLHQRYQWRHWIHLGRVLPARFPSHPESPRERRSHAAASSPGA